MFNPDLFLLPNDKSRYWVAYRYTDFCKNYEVTHMHVIKVYLCLYLWKNSGRGNSVSTATRYGLGYLGIESRWRRDFPSPVQTVPGAHPASYTMDTLSFSGVKRLGRGVGHPRNLAPMLKEE
jgi:hypothetical protein